METKCRECKKELWLRDEYAGSIIEETRICDTCRKMEKLKPQDLRIGNYVTFNNDDLILVKSIFEKGVHDEYYNGYNYYDIKPIPLTEQWLVDFGFKKNKNNWKELYLGLASISWERLAGLVLVLETERIYMPHIKYIHSLQNLFHTLTGQELTLNKIK